MPESRECAVRKCWIFGRIGCASGNGPVARYSMKTCPGAKVPCWGRVSRRWACILLGFACLFQPSAELKLGTRTDQIGTFNGWIFLFGWEGSFSDSYAPEKEKYSWNVFVAPEAIYVGLLAQQSVYSGVDVNMGIKYFYGFLKAPDGATMLDAGFLSDGLWSVSFSVGYPDATPPVGVMSLLSLGFEVEQAFFRKANTRVMVPGVQWGTGFSASFSLLPVSLPLTVELDRDWVAPPTEPEPSLFWPVTIWSRPADPARNAIDQIQDAVRNLANDESQGASTSLIGTTLQPLIDRIAADQDLRTYLDDPSSNLSRIHQAISATETWLVTGDTGTLPETLKPIKTYPEANEIIIPVLCVTQMAFETGYRVGAQANPNNRTVYIDGVVTNYCVAGEKCVLEVPVAELIQAVPGHTPSEFEGAWIGFDSPVDGSGSFETLGRVNWVQLKDGAARFTIAQSLSTPQLLGVRYDDPADHPLNDGRDVELKRRLILFLDPADLNQNGIPDFWEGQYGLVNPTPGADADGDGVSDFEEYVADTDPTDPRSFFLIQMDRGEQCLVLPFASNIRRYVIEANTNSVSNATGWINVMDFMGSDAQEYIDLSPVFREPKAFFRVRVKKP